MQARCKDISLEYEEVGSGDPIVLVMGIGAQLVHWDERFCVELSGRGFRVIRFDNRDVGLSSKLDGVRAPPPMQALVRGMLGLPVRAPYTLSDMAGDTVGLLDALGIERAHLVGVSMGGMIAQHVALEHPRRVRTLTSIMSTTGDRLAGYPQRRALQALLGPAPRTREEAADRAVKTFRVIGSPGFARDEPNLRAIAMRAFDRGANPAGFLRQFAAIFASGGRGRALRNVRAPTLVIHGAEDPLIPLRAGRATAKAIPDARLLVIPGMGHDLAPGTWPMIIDAIAKHAKRG
jgi:pimeloyl-ACP methyl ester carboxylesterase